MAHPQSKLRQYQDSPDTCPAPQGRLSPVVCFVAVMEATLQECKALGVLRLNRIMNVGENPVAWSYEIRDSNNLVVSTAKGFDAEKIAMAAGRKKARELKASGSLPGGGVATVRAKRDSDVLVPRD